MRRNACFSTIAWTASKIPFAWSITERITSAVRNTNSARQLGKFLAAQSCDPARGADKQAALRRVDKHSLRGSGRRPGSQSERVMVPQPARVRVGTNRTHRVHAVEQQNLQA